MGKVIEMRELVTGARVAVIAVLAFLVLPAVANAEPGRPYTSIVQTTPLVCRGGMDYDLVKLTLNAPSTDAMQFRSGCTGRIGRLEIEGRFADCLKVNPPAPAAHDVRIESGYCRVTGPAATGVHQDCIQAGGGSNFLFTNFVFSCWGGGGGNWFIASFNGGTPRNFICDHCAFGPEHPNQIRTPSDPASGVSNSLVCQSTSGRDTYIPDSGNKGGNISPAASSPQCSWAGLVEYVGGSAPPPPPPPPPPAEAPTLTICANYATNFTLCWPRLTGVTRFNFYVDGVAVSHSLNPALERVRFGKQMGTHRYGVEAVYADGAGYSEVVVTR